LGFQGRISNAGAWEPAKSCVIYFVSLVPVVDYFYYWDMIRMILKSEY